MKTNQTQTKSRRRFVLTTAIGALLLAVSPHIASAANNLATGPSAGVSFTTGVYNTAYGINALRFDTTGSYNTAVGPNALVLNVGGTQNTGIGVNALQANVGGSYNVGLGVSALYANNSGTYNTGIGNSALYANTTGAQNTAIGLNAMLGNKAGSFNAALGLNALATNVNGNNNTAVGYRALFAATGSGNIGIGLNAGQNLTSGSNNIYIGNDGVAADSGIIRIGTAQTDTYLTGTIHGNGTGLTNISASAITGTLIGTQIASASINSINLHSNLTLGGTTTGTFSGNLTGSVSGNATGFSGALAGDVTGTQGATVVSTVGGVNATSVANVVTLANAATPSDTPSSLVFRDANGNFFAHTVALDGTAQVDRADANNGSFATGLPTSNALYFGFNFHEGIASDRTGASGNLQGLDFYTNITRRMSITNAGGVGIGTNTPATALEVSGGAATSIRVSSTTPNDAGIQFNRGNGSNSYSLVDKNSGELFIQYSTNSFATTIDLFRLQQTGLLAVTDHAGGTLKPVPVAEERLTMLRGGVTGANGHLAKGAGFSSSRISTGNYLITFDTPYSSVPSVTCTAIGGNNNITVTTGNLTTTAVSVFVNNGNNVNADSDFDFTVMGTR